MEGEKNQLHRRIYRPSQTIIDTIKFTIRNRISATRFQNPSTASNLLQLCLFSQVLMKMTPATTRMFKEMICGFSIFWIQGFRRQTHRLPRREAKVTLDSGVFYSAPVKKKIKCK